MARYGDGRRKKLSEAGREGDRVFRRQRWLDTEMIRDRDGWRQIGLDTMVAGHRDSWRQRRLETEMVRQRWSESCK